MAEYRVGTGFDAHGRMRLSMAESGTDNLRTKTRLRFWLVMIGTVVIFGVDGR